MTQLLGQYRLLRKLAQGGMAEVWLADAGNALGVARRVVVKKMLPSWAKDEELVRMFVTEARVAMGLSHGNIAQVFDFGEEDGEFFLAMEYLEGASLDQLEARTAARELALPAPIATFVAIEIAKGLHYAHSRTGDDGRPLGIVHRDVSPQNVFVTFDGEVKVLDFGLAKLTSEKGHTQPGILKGKYLYFSPEQAKGGAVDARTDVYATGVVLYEMLAGSLPVRGGMGDALGRIIAGDFPPPSEHADVPPELEALVLQAMARDPAERFPTAAAFEQELGRFLYKHAPRFGAETVAHFTRFLHQTELAAAGKRPVFPEAFLEQLSIWRKLERPRPRGDSDPAAGTDHAVALADHTAPRSSAPEAALSPIRRGRRTPVIAALGIVAGLAAGTLAWPLLRGPPRGELRVASEPPGASISLDGTATARATTAEGVLLGDLSPGPHLLLLSRLGYEDARVPVTLDASDERSLRGQRIEAHLVPRNPKSTAPVDVKHVVTKLDLRWLDPSKKALRQKLNPAHKYSLRANNESMRLGVVNSVRVKTVFFLAINGKSLQAGLVTPSDEASLENVADLFLFFVDADCTDNQQGVGVHIYDATLDRSTTVGVSGARNCVPLTPANCLTIDGNGLRAFTASRPRSFVGPPRPLGYLLAARLTADWTLEHHDEASWIMGTAGSGERVRPPIPFQTLWLFGIGSKGGLGAPDWTADFETLATSP
jgi:serine/threonine protein kinase